MIPQISLTVGIHNFRGDLTDILANVGWKASLHGCLDNSDWSGVAEVSELERIPSYWDGFQATSRVPSPGSRPTCSGFRLVKVRVIETLVYPQVNIFNYTRHLRCHACHTPDSKSLLLIWTISSYQCCFLPWPTLDMFSRRLQCATTKRYNLIKAEERL